MYVCVYIYIYIYAYICICIYVYIGREAQRPGARPHRELPARGQGANNNNISSKISILNTETKINNNNKTNTTNNNDNTNDISNIANANVRTKRSWSAPPSSRTSGP